MGWGLRLFAGFVGVVALGLGAWPVFLLVAAYLAFSFMKPKPRRAKVVRQELFPKPKRAWGRYVLGAFLFLLASTALGAGGTLSPVVFLLSGIVVLSWPRLRTSSLASHVVPVRESVLLRSRLFPLRWHALAEVKLESQDQTRGVAAMDGRLLVFAGKTPSAFRVVSVFALGYGQAEEKVVNRLRRETRLLSQRGAHLLPLDSEDAKERLSLELDRLNIGTEDLEAVTSLPFDVIALQVRDGLVVAHRAFRIAETVGTPLIPCPDLSGTRQPLLAEVVDEIGQRHGWPGPDEFSPFIAALDASRAEPIADRIVMKGEKEGKLLVETTGGAPVGVTRPQLRALSMIYR
ncbi:MAG TPA: hypothetical protein VEJ19_02080 [Nitrososphaerales archaeon]|nr:hypothetical protein [Nitrososphaerales archaeon]